MAADALQTVVETPFPAAATMQCPYDYYAALHALPPQRLPTGEFAVARRADILEVTRQPGCSPTTTPCSTTAGCVRRRSPIAAMARYRSTFYLVANHIVDGIEGDRAWGETYGIGHHHQVAEDRPERVIVNPIRYRDRYVRTGEGWRFEERVATVLWTETRDVRS